MAKTINYFKNSIVVKNMQQPAQTAMEAYPQGQTVSFFVYGGRKDKKRNALGQNILHSVHALCSVMDVAAITGQVKNERTTTELGKRDYTTNDGYTFNPNITIKAEDLYGVAYIIGKEFYHTEDADYGNLAASAILANGDRGIMGALIIHVGNKDWHLRSSICVPQCRITIDEFATGKAESFTLKITSESEPIKTMNGQMIACENFLDDSADVTNTHAPNGILTTFAIGRGNNSLPSPLPTGVGLPLQPVRDGEPDYSNTEPMYWLYEVCIDGVPVNEGDILVFDRQSGRIGFNFAPADGSALSIIYALPTAVPNFSESKEVYPYELVKYNNTYYYASVYHLGAWDIADFVAATDYLTYMSSYIPHLYGSSLNNDNVLGYPTCMTVSWGKLNFLL